MKRRSILVLVSLTEVLVSSSVVAAARRRAPTLAEIGARAAKICPTFGNVAKLADTEKCLRQKMPGECEKVLREASKVVGVDGLRESWRRTAIVRAERCKEKIYDQATYMQIQSTVVDLVEAELAWDKAFRGAGVRIVQTNERVLAVTGALSQMCNQVTDSDGESHRWLFRFLGENGADVAGTCGTQLVKGFLCNIPDFIGMLSSLVLAISDEAQKGWCRAIPNGLAGPKTLCALVGLFKTSAQKWSKCLSDIKGAFPSLIQLVLVEGFKAGCQMGGQLLFDAVITFLSGGFALPAVIAKWITKLISTANARGFGARLAPVAIAVRDFAATAKSKGVAGLKKAADATNASTWIQGLADRKMTVVNSTGVDTIQGTIQNMVAGLNECNIPPATMPDITGIFWDNQSAYDGRDLVVEAGLCGLTPITIAGLITGEELLRCLQWAVPARCEAVERYFKEVYLKESTISSSPDLVAKGQSAIQAASKCRNDFGKISIWESVKQVIEMRRKYRM